MECRTTPRVCILSLSPIARDARVLRQVEFAKDKYVVDVVAYGEWTPEWRNVHYQDVGPKFRSPLFRYMQGVLLLLGHLVPQLWRTAYWFRKSHRRSLEYLAGLDFDLIHANDLNALPIAVESTKQKSTKVLFDAHEYSPGQRTDTWLGNVRSSYAAHLLASYAQSVDQIVTVSEGLANLYTKIFDKEPVVVRNIPYKGISPPSPVASDRIDLVHHGNAVPGRGLEQLIQAMAHVDARFHLNLMLIDKNPGYSTHLRNLAEDINSRHIHFLDPVSPQQIVQRLNTFDIGVVVIRPSNLNYLYTLPNKFFDFIAAPLATMVGPLPDMAAIVEHYKIGVIVPGYEAEDIAAALNSLSPQDISNFKQNAWAAADVLNAEVELEKLQSVYENLLRGS